ncbi:hypothetical protein [Sphingomonas sp. GB1N7]|uniref:hypothetical protein n=1 Tax=Parasphingomonas caseinilytica TaxID=3096158 RepID=UPI002FC62A4E
MAQVAIPAATVKPVVATEVVQTPSANGVMLQPVAGESILRVGTPVPLKTSEELTTKGKKLKVGQRFQMEVAENMTVNGSVVVPAGSPAVGEITDVRNKGMWGKSGHLAARILYLTVNGRQIRLSGAFDDKGTAGGIGAAAVSAVVFLPAGFFMTGTSAKIALGAPVKGFIDEDVPFVVNTAAVKPITVVAPVASVPVAGAVAPVVPIAAPAPAKK